MTTSGTTIFNLDFTEILEEVFERAGAESRSGYDMRTGRRSANLMMLEWANRGVNLWTVEERAQVLTPGVKAYTLGTDIVDLIEQMLTVPNQIAVTRYNLTRVSVATFATRTNPDLTGRPTEIYIDRQRDAPIVYLWPVPDRAGYIMPYWVLRRIEDAGAYGNTADVPFRFLPAFIAGLAFYIAEKKQPGNVELIMRLKARYDEEWQRAADEDREKATLMITPRPAYIRQ